ncbi:MAG TPA: hypothetical protein VL728_15730 [Cyclobacteriaceae bacterium]|jgi:hypothetical protein|nr:hypothetical protein [Cyclobacteriaceae bacterium]
MYKYRINHFLSCLPSSKSIEKFRDNLKTKHNISPEIFHVDRFLKFREHTIIPLERLEIYAKEFKVAVDELHAKQEDSDGRAGKF